MFKQNIAQWAWDFHDAFMKRKGATKTIRRPDRQDAAQHGGTDRLPGAQPERASSATPRRSRSRSGSLRPTDNANLAQNPAAGLDALKNSLTQFAAAMTAPGMDAVGPGLQSLAHGVQAMAAAYEEWSKAHPKAAEAASVGGMAGAAGAGGRLTWKLFTGIGRLFGFGGGAAGEGTAAGIAAGAAGGGGVLSALGAAVLAGAEALAR